MNTNRNKNTNDNTNNKNINENKNRKQIPLRLSQRLYNEIARWAEDDFRSINGQIEYLLSECVRRRKRI